MKTISIILGLMIGITTVTIAQEADSVVVTYDNLHTTIPLPAFGKQTTIKMADSIQMIEIGVSRRKLSDFAQANNIYSLTAAPGKQLKKTKWYSQIEAGYTLKFYSGPSSDPIIINGTEPTTLYYNTDNTPGYKVGISIFENERSLNERFSYISGFKIGFAQSFRKYKDIPFEYDTTARMYVGFEPVTTTSLQFLFPLGFRQYLGTGKSGSSISFGANIGSSINLVKQKRSSYGAQFSGTPLVIDPFIGFEKGKFGIRASADLSFVSKYVLSTRETGLKVDYGLGLSLTYRFF
jgi:hypothetical protein